MPEELAAAGVISGAHAFLADIAFAPLASAAPGRVAALRKRLSPHAQLVAVVAEHDQIRLESVDRLFADGINDLIDARSASEVSLCITRAKAAIRHRQWLYDEIEPPGRERNTLLAAMNSLPSPIFFKDQNGIYRAFNKAFETFFGRKRSQILGASAFDITAFPTASIFLEADQKLIADGGPQVYDTGILSAAGELRHVTFYKSLVRRDDGTIEGIAGAMIDISERKELEARLRDAADRDFLTGLPNRRHFLRNAAVKMADNQDQGRLSYIAIGDIDHFKSVNDRHGHACGDAVLRRIADILKASLGSGHLFARAGGEEFFIMLDCDSFTAAKRLLETVRGAIAQSPVDWEDERMWITASFGLTDVRSDERSLSSPLARADEALYAAKNRGRNQVLAMETEFVSDWGGI